MNILAHKKTLIIVLGILGVIIIILVTVLLLKPGTSQDTDTTIPTPTGNAVPLPFQEKIYDGQQVIIGKTTQNEVKQLPGLISENELEDGETEYLFDSSLKTRPNVVITKDNVAIYERTLTPPTSFFPKISEYLSKYGTPEEIVKGSKEYGWSINSYIYSSKGFSIIGNPNTDEIYEFQFFVPQTVNDYTKNYGEDLSPDEKPPVEIPY